MGITATKATAIVVIIDYWACEIGDACVLMITVSIVGRVAGGWSRLEANAGLLTNCEALQLLQSRGADKGFGVTAAECKVYDYLVKTPAGSQTREGLQEFFKGAEEYKLTKAEYLQASNLRPSTAVEVHLIVEDCDERLSSALVDRFLGMIDETLPPPPELLEDAEAQKEEAVIKADEEDGGSGQ
ncbi:unnamed protein product [Sphagnum troendelagicum]|uniref:DNA-directed RNA polymerase III subunit RPC9 n=1 Tax=Sphagnum troendelagicum TaxID=128251 RepID=A0ABP0TYH3_9BRYO